MTNEGEETENRREKEKHVVILDSHNALLYISTSRQCTVKSEFCVSASFVVCARARMCTHQRMLNGDSENDKRCLNHLNCSSAVILTAAVSFNYTQRTMNEWKHKWKLNCQQWNSLHSWPLRHVNDKRENFIFMQNNEMNRKSYFLLWWNSVFQFRFCFMWRIWSWFCENERQKGLNKRRTRAYFRHFAVNTLYY